MNNLILKFVAIVIGVGTSGILMAAPQSTEHKTAYIRAVDTQKRVIFLNNEMYYISPRIKVVYSVKRFPSIRDLESGMRVDYKTINNKNSGRVEVNEIWVKPQ